ncbi:MAG: DUF3592 domain-containing protein [Deltaproteobacteria bacterium]|nr:DUF3592 domain-containing protein [Deltaproteobacteria bacterium]
MGVVVGAVLLLGGALLVWSGVRARRACARVAAWPPTRGRIVHREVAPSTRTTGTGPPGTRFEALVRYTYEVAGAAHEGDRIYAEGWVTGTRAERQRFLDGLPEEVTVRHDPSDPARSCLLTPPVGVAWVMLIVGALLLVVGAGALLAAFGGRGA